MFPVPADWAAAGPAYPSAAGAAAAGAADGDSGDCDRPAAGAKKRRKRAAAAAAAAEAVVSLTGVVPRVEAATSTQPPPPTPPGPRPAAPAPASRKKAPHAAAAHAPPPAAAPARPPKQAKRDREKKQQDKARTAVADPVVLSAPPPPPAARPPPRKAGKRNKFRPAAAAAERETEEEEAKPAAPAAAPASTPFLDAARSRLAAGAFRSLNEALYTRPGAASLAEFAASPALFAQYHAGFRAAVARWPSSPLAAATQFVHSLPPASRVVDFGCGEAGLAAAVGAHARVTSLDLVAASDAVIACDMAATPLPPACADAAVFCLALMGTDYPLALAEAGRVLRGGGDLWIAEVRSRFAAGDGGRDDPRPFVRAVTGVLGFDAVDVGGGGNPMFVVLRFRKRTEGGRGKGAPAARRRDAAADAALVARFPALRPCTYKRR